MLLLGWSILEFVAYLWLEAVVVVLVACAWIVANRGRLALVLVPAYLAAMGVLLSLQLLLLTLAFFVMRFQDGFFDVVAEGERVVRGVAWGALVVAAWHAAGFVLAARDPARRPRTRRALLHATTHVLLLMVFSLASVAIVRDLRAPALALALVVLLKVGVDAGLYAAGRRWPALAA